MRGKDVAQERVAALPFPIEIAFSQEQQASEPFERERRRGPDRREGQEVDVRLEQHDVPGACTRPRIAL